MSENRSIRLDSAVLSALTAYAARHPGLSSAAAAALFVDEGLRMDAHPAVNFRSGPSGRRAVLVGGPDVWQVIRSVRDTRATEPSSTSGQVLEIVESNTGVSPSQLRAALDYYGAFGEEIEAEIEAADIAEAELESAVSRTNQLLGR